MPNDVPPDETRMRAALGLLRDPQPQQSGHRPDHGSHRHRFVRDGEVAVTVVNSTGSENGSGRSPRSRLMAVEDALAAERSAHARTRRELEDAFATIQALETKHAHAELAHSEAIRREQTARAQAEAAVQQLQARLEEAEVQARQRAPAPSEPREIAQPARPRGRPPRQRADAIEAVEPEPVEWWLPGWRAKVGC